MEHKLNRTRIIYQFFITSFIACTLLVVTPASVSGKNYYFSTSIGNDTRTSIQAQNQSTPWKSISQLNSYFPNLMPGDSVLFKRGEIFYGTIIVKKSGTQTQPITIGAFGSGKNPTISGFVTLSSWINLGSSIWQAVLPTSNTSLNMVVVNGLQRAMGRYPNSTFLTYEAVSGNTSITDNQLTASPNWAGAEVVIRKIRWMLDRNLITKHVNSTLTYQTGSDWSPTAGYGYFIQNDPRTLDAFGEWYFNPSDKTVKIFSATNPSSLTIKASALSSLVTILNYDFITLANITFEGSNNDAIVIEGGNKVIVKNCTINFSGTSAIATTDSSQNAIVEIDGNIINNANRCAILLGNSTTSAWVKNNLIKNIGLLQGAGTSDNDSGDGIYTRGKNTLIEYNKFDSIGHIGIKMTTSDSIVIRYNEISNYSLTRYDGGGVYTWNPTGTVPYGQQIKQNIILNSNQVGTGIGTATILNIRGIYCDDNSINIDIDGNSVYNASTAGIYLLRSANIKINNNTCFNNGHQLALRYAFGTDLPIRNLDINNNILVAKTASQLAFYFQTTMNDIRLFGKSNNNIFARPIDDNLTIQTIDATTGTVDRTLAGWQTFSGQDLKSKKSPNSITNINDLRFEYNATKENKTILLPGTFKDFNGTIYVNSITLKPYTSAVLMQTSASINLTPVIQNQNFVIDEQSLNGTIIGTVIASNPNPGQTLSYSIVSGNSDGTFSINVLTGVITVANSSNLNIKTTPIYSMIVKVVDNLTGVFSNQATINVSLTSSAGCSATGNIAYQVWSNIGATSSINSLTSNANYPDNPTSTSQLSSMEAPANRADYFGARIAGFICAPATGNYTFWIASADHGELWLSTDDKPENVRKIASVADWTSYREWNKYLSQKSIGVALVKGQTYYIEALMKENVNSDNLSVGWLKPGQTGTVPSEVVPGSVLSPLVPINHAPVIVNQSFQVNENSAINTLVGNILATDADANQALYYSIVSVNNDNTFVINSSTGNLTIANSAFLNFESSPVYTLVVKVQDNGAGVLSSEAEITINIINVNETPVISYQSFSINDDATSGTIVGSVFATDEDAGQKLTYSILSGNTNNAFAINATTGILTVLTPGALNFQTSPVFSLLVEVQDNGIVSLRNKAVITVNLIYTGCTATGNISYAVWQNIGSSSSVASLTSNANYPNNPTTVSVLTSMEAPINQGDLFGARIAGYICAPATGNYTFWIASSDNGELWLSPNGQSTNKVKIAYHTGWTSSREWNKYTTQKSAVINLVQGQTYYIEALMKESINRDNLAIGWILPGQTGTVPSEVIPGTVLSPLGTIKSGQVKIDNSASFNPEIKLTVYPNPLNSGTLNINVENVSVESTLQIFSTSGVLFYTQQISTTETIHLDRSFFKSGLYVIRVLNNDIITTSKFIVN